jgi:hypothetical protein
MDRKIEEIINNVRYTIENYPYPKEDLVWGTKEIEALISHISEQPSLAYINGLEKRVKELELRISVLELQGGKSWKSIYRKLPPNGELVLWFDSGTGNYMINTVAYAERHTYKWWIPLPRFPLREKVKIVKGEEDG